MALRAVAGLDEGARLKLLERTCNGGVKIVSTTLSGTDAIVDAQEVVLWAVGKLTKTSPEKMVKLQHVFSCEHIDWNRDAIAARPAHPEAIFGKVEDLAEGVADDTISGGAKVIPRANESFGGFPCTQFSSLNFPWKRQEAARCIEHGTGDSGKGFHDEVQYLKSQHVAVVGMENVARHKLTQVLAISCVLLQLPWTT